MCDSCGLRAGTEVVQDFDLEKILGWTIECVYKLKV
jgi:hypothetical protein